MENSLDNLIKEKNINFNNLIFFYNPKFLKCEVLESNKDNLSEFMSKINLLGISCKENELIDKYVLIDKTNMQIILYGGSNK